jgi:serine/threonine-protein kinase
MSAPAERDPAIASAETKGYTVTAVPAVPFGKYVLIGKLGHGGMAEVNLAVMSGKGNFRKLVVIKRMHAHLEAEPGFVDMFLDEARLAAQLDHPHCVQTLEVGEANGLHFLAMEYLDGQGLERLLRITGQRGETLPPGLVARMVADALDGLGYAHELTAYDGQKLGVVHRDVSPQNLFVTYNGVVKLLDFGIAKAASNVVETRTGVVKGKYAYIAPEQALATPVDARADVWAMGVVFWEMLTSRRLFKSHNELATLQETLTAVIHPPSSVVPGIPAELDRIALRALERDVSKRYQTAFEFKDDLERYLDTAPDRAERRDIAKLMQERFGEAVKVHRARIAECLAAVERSDKTVQRLVEGNAISASAEMQSLQVPVGPPSQPQTPVPYMTPSGISLSPRVSHQHVAGGPYPTPMPSNPGMVVGQGYAPNPPNYGGHTPPPGYLQTNAYMAPYPTPMPGPVPQGAIAPPMMSGSQELTPPPGTSPFGAMPPKKDEQRPFAIWLVALGALALLGVLGFVVWPRLSGGAAEEIPPTGVGVVVVSGTAVSGIAPTALAPDPSVLGPAPTAGVALTRTPDGESGSHHPTHRRPVAPDPTHVEVAVAPPPPPPSSAPAATGGDGYLSLITSPWTHVTEGGRDLGDTPLVRVPLSAGHHSLHLVNPEALVSETYDVDITAGQTTSRRLGLQ